MATQSHDYQDCNRQLEKLIKKVKKEITKVEKLIESSNKANKAQICHEPSRDEKKQILNTIKQSSVTCCSLLEELKKHRTEVKYLLNAFNKLMKKHDKLKTIRQNQLEQVKEIHYYVKSELSPMIKAETVKATKTEKQSKNQSEENEKLERALKEIEAQHAALLKECEKEQEVRAERTRRLQEEDRHDKMLFSFVMRCIRKAFNIRANIECRPTNFVEYMFPDVQNNYQNDYDDGEELECCCD